MTAARRSPSIYDVAVRAGVSHQTVSRVLNGSARIRAETRERVLAAIQELGYRRNAAAQQLATNRSRTIGVLAPAAPDFGPVSTMYAVERAAREAGYHALVTSSEPDPVSVQDALDFLLGRAIEALAVIAPYRSTLDAVAALDQRLPVVVLQTGEAAGGDVVAVDQREGARLVVEHLVELGHERIQHLAGPPDFIEARLRREGFAAEIARHGLAELPVLDGEWSVEAGYLAAQRLDPSATAVFCASDQMALGLIHALSERGRDVPADVSVTGFDDVPEAAHLRPPLTTVHQDFAAVGDRAVASLVARLEGRAVPAAAAIAPRLVVRGSTARPPR